MKTIMNSGTFFSVMNFLYLLRHSHIRALVPCPGLTSEVCVVASTSVPLTEHLFSIVSNLTTVHFSWPCQTLAELVGLISHRFDLGKVSFAKLIWPSSLCTSS